MSLQINVSFGMLHLSPSARIGIYRLAFSERQRTQAREIAQGTSNPGGGALTLEGSIGMCRPLDPFFRTFFSSGDPPFQALFQLQRPHFYFSENFAIFSPIFCWFWLNFNFWETHFRKNFILVTPVSSQKISSEDPTFENLGGTYIVPTQNFSEYPPPPASN